MYRSQAFTASGLGTAAAAMPLSRLSKMRRNKNLATRMASSLGEASACVRSKQWIQTRLCLAGSTSPIQQGGNDLQSLHRHAKVRGNELPLPAVIFPYIGEAVVVFVRLAFV